MEIHPIPEKAQHKLLEDAAGRDRTTARRVQLFKILWNERFLTRAQLIVRVEGVLGAGCFGEHAWQDAFYRDMRIVKEAFNRAGYSLGYSRRKRQPGYYLRNQPHLNPALARAIQGSVSEIEPAQLEALRRLTSAERFQQGCSLSDTARRVVIHRIRERQPELSVQEASRLALARNRGSP